MRPRSAASATETGCKLATFRTRALVVKKTKLGEADLILTMMAESGAQIRCVAKGARKPKGRFSGRFELFAEVDVTVYEGKKLGTITDVSVVAANSACRRDMEHLSYAAVMAQFVEKSTFEGQENPVLYQLTLAAVQALGDGDPALMPFVLAAYLIKASAYMGVKPSFDECVSCGLPREGEAAGTFSISAGGWVCGSCSREEGAQRPDDAVDPVVAQWIKALTALRFSEVLGREELREGSLNYLAGTLLDFCDRWLQQHLGLRLKTMSYLSMLQ